jgi:hypothetical protein
VVKIYEGLDFSHLPREVETLFSLSGHESFFSLAGWYQLITECGVAGPPRTGIALDDSNRVALPFRRAPNERSLRSCTSIYTCEYDVLSDRASASLVRAFATALVSAIRPLDYLRLEGMNPARFTFAALIDGFRASGFVVKPYVGWGTWFESTLGVDFERYLSARPSVLRNTWKRKSAALAKAANAAFRTYGVIDDPGSYIEIYERVREQSWKAAEPFPAFIPGLIRFAARNGALRLGILDIDGVPAAAQFWIVWAGRATIYKLVYAEKFAAFSPGTLLTMHMVQNVLDEDQPSEIDFGHGDDAYKQLWLSERRERWGIEAGNPRTWRGFAHSTRLQAGLVRDRMRPRSPGSSAP